MFTQLNPPIPLHVLGKGDGYAIGVIDYGQEHNLLWVTALNASGEIWCAPNPQVRMGKNWSMGRAESPLVAADKAQASEAKVADGLCADCSETLASTHS
jgi:hypothetical protein